MESFNGYYSYQDCQKALQQSKDDIQEAAQYLVDEIDQDLQKRVIHSEQQTLLCQSELVGEINQKSILKNKELITKENSLVYLLDVENENWTMNRD